MPGPRTWTTRRADPKFGRVGKQKIEDTGKLTRKRMETVDGEVLGQTLKWLDKHGKSDKPFFCWYNSTAIHIRSRSPQKYIQMAVDEGRPEEDVVRARMIEHDELVGSLLKKLDELGVADNTIVIYTTDNGNELMLWPDGGYAPVPRREGHHLGRWRARPDAGEVARQDQARQRVQWHPEPRRCLCHPRRGGRSAEPQARTAHRQEDGRA